MISNIATFEECPPVGDYAKKPTTQFSPLWGARAIGQFHHVPPQCPTGKPRTSSWPKHPDTRWKSLPGPGWDPAMQGLGSLGQSWITELLGKSKTWYAHLNYVQNVLTAQQAEIAAIGAGPWDIIARANPKILPLYKPQEADLQWRLKQILVRTNYTPSDRSITLAFDGSKIYRTRITFVKKKIAPSQAVASTAAGKEMYAKVSKVKLRSPAAAGVQTFIKEVSARAESLLPSGWPWWVWAAVAAGGVFSVGYAIRAMKMK